jgi:MinD-like ATPase involved in chromosome partitioning or flagellar assembly
MAQAIHSRTPLMAQAPDSPAGRAISQLAARLVYHSPKSSESVPFFQQLFKSNHHQDNTPVSTN